MKAIKVTYRPATNSRGSRLLATDGMNRVSVPYPYHLHHDQCHAYAAIELCRKMGWKGKLISGGFADGTEVFVFAHSDCYDIEKGVE